MAKVAYKRVSSIGQNTARQLDGMTFDKEFEDKASGKDLNRPQLQAMLEYIREGDEVFVHSICRAARSLVDLKNLVSMLNDKQVSITFVKEDLTFKPLKEGEKQSHIQNLTLGLLGSFVEFERALIRERQREGIEAARAAGKPLGRQAALKPAQIEEIRKRAKEGASKVALASEYGVSRATIYAALAPA